MGALPHTGLAIIAGDGDLPRLLAENGGIAKSDLLIVNFATQTPAWMGAFSVLDASIFRLGHMFDGMRAHGCGTVVFAGKVARPAIDPARFDEKTREIAPRLLPALNRGDDTTLRAIAGIFESEGFRVSAPHSLMPELLAPGGLLTSAEPRDQDQTDIRRAEQIVAALGAVDVGQGAVVARGLCLGVESIQGTDRMLECVAKAQARDIPRCGVLFKSAKPGQDRRMDMPAIGARTVELAAKAGLAGIALGAGAALILERPKVVETADAHGLFVIGIQQGG